MTATTTPDGLRYPDDPEAPADSINAFAQLAADVQTALNTKPDIVPTSALVTPTSNWSNASVAGYGQPTVYKVGRMVFARGMMTRLTVLTVVDNGVYDVGTIPAGYRPIVAFRAATGWTANNGSNPQVMTTQVLIDAAGSLKVYSNVAGSMQIGQWVSLGGIAWVTP